jgi:hypothetical protein
VRTALNYFLELDLADVRARQQADVGYAPRSPTARPAPQGER